MAESDHFVLSIDTSGPVLGLALIHNGELHSSREDMHGLRHTENLLPAVESFLTDQHRFAPLDGVSVANGPGSFTGLRIALATAKALGFAWRCPVVSVGTLHSMAETVRYLRFRAGNPVPAAVMPVLDARKNRYYTAVFVPDPSTGTLNRVTEDLDIPMEELQVLANRYPGVCLAGPDKEEGASGAIGAGILGALLIEQGVRDDPYAGPDYLRREDIGTAKKGPRFQADG